MAQGGLSVLEGKVLDMVAAGKTPRQIAEVVGISPAEASKLAYDLLDSEIITDSEQRRNLQIYRLERIIDALWERVMKHADRDDVNNMLNLLKELNGLLGLYKESNEELYDKMHAHQFAMYSQTLMFLLKTFKILAPNTFDTDDQWTAWMAEALTTAEQQLEVES